MTLRLLKSIATIVALPSPGWHGPTEQGQQERSSLRDMIQQKFKQEMFAKPQEEMLTIQAKNTTLHRNGQNLRPAAKKGRNSKTPGHEREAAGHLVTSLPTEEGLPQLDLLALKSPKPDVENQTEIQALRRPLKLAPLELPEKVKEAQKEKLKFIHQEPNPASCKLDGTHTRKAKSCMRQRLVKAEAFPSASIAPVKAQQQNQSARPQLTRANPIEQDGHKHLEDVVCRGTPAPLCSKPNPPSFFPQIKAQAACGREAACHIPGNFQEETGWRRLRLPRAQCLEEDQCNSNTSTLGLSADECKLVQGVQGKGQRGERLLRGQPHVGKGIKQPPAPAASWENGSARKSHEEDGSKQAAL
ncbi:uncharacterized protein LOC113014704 [Astatotilapia calliptera]|uniref:uncharacterized protein LOC113014704 n=1 Tax=Astatotilapia calliptera TaxID=8154 RepID=UPI000E41AC79|nr:uncharacterized protein LOC113014704 [Astatotilapia calliptera]